MLTKIIIFILSVGYFGINAQLPTTNIYQFTITQASDKFSIHSPKMLTSFNMNGYNNQPHFFEDDVVYFTTNYYQSDQTEIAKIDFLDEVMTRITYTQESEYSPTPIPQKDGFSCVRVEADGITQSLSVYPLDGIGYAKRYMNNTKNIGYHSWIDAKTLALFLVEEPNHNLAIADAVSERRKIILDKIGRTLKVSADNQLYFLHKVNEKEWFIKSYNPATSQSVTITNSLPGVEDFELLMDGSLISGDSSTIYRYNPKSGTSWEAIMNLTEYGITNITRIAARKNSLLVVDQK